MDARVGTPAGRIARRGSPLAATDALHDTRRLARSVRGAPGTGPDRVLRVSIIVLIGMTLVVAIVPTVHGHVVAPAVDLVMDTIAMVVCASLAVLSWIRFTGRRESIALYQAAGFFLLAIAYGTAVAVSLGRDASPLSLADPLVPQTLVFAIARVGAAALLVVGGTVMQHRAPPRHATLALLVPGLALLVLTAVAYLLPAMPAALQLIAPAVTDDGLPAIRPIGLVVQVLTAVLFFEAALVCHRLWRSEQAVFDAWLAIGLVIGGFAEIQWIFYPSGHPGQVSSADLLRLLAFLALLIGIEAEARVTVSRLRAANVELAGLRDIAADQAAVQERGRLARELHDGLAQDLWLAKLKTGQLAAVEGLPVAALPLLAATEDAIDSGLTEARQAVLALRLASVEDGGFCMLMRRFVEDFEDRFGLRVEFGCDGDSEDVAPRTQAEVLRIAQEALTNVRQHAAATVVGIRLTIKAGRVTLRVVDNGCGFDARDAGSGSFGLASMRERAALIGGRLEIRSRPGSGTTILVSAPLAAPVTAAAPAVARPVP